MVVVFEEEEYKAQVELQDVMQGYLSASPIFYKETVIEMLKKAEAKFIVFNDLIVYECVKRGKGMMWNDFPIMRFPKEWVQYFSLKQE